MSVDAKAQEIAKLILSMTLDELDCLTEAFYDYYHAKIDDDTDGSFDLDMLDCWTRLVWDVAKGMPERFATETTDGP